MRQTEQEMGDICSNIELAEYYGKGLSFLNALTATAVNILIHISATHMDPMNVVFWNAVWLICICVIALCITKPQSTGSIQETLLLVLSGFFGGCGSVVFSLAVMISKEPGDAVALYFTLPISVIVLEIFFDRGKLKILYVVFASLSVIGVVAVVKPNFLFHAMSSDHATDTLGALLSLTSSFLMAAHFIVVKKLKIFSTNFLIVVTLTNIYVLSISSLLCVYFQVFSVPDTVDKVMFVFVTGCLYGSVYSLIYFSLANERPVVVSIIMTSEVVLTYTAQFVILRLAITWYSVLGGIFITVSCIGVALAKQDEEEDPENLDLLQEY